MWDNYNLVVLIWGPGMEFSCWVSRALKEKKKTLSSDFYVCAGDEFALKASEVSFCYSHSSC